MAASRSDDDSPAGRFRPALLAAAFFTAGGLLSFGYRYLDLFVRSQREPFHVKLVEELTGWWGVGLLFPLVIVMARRLRPRPWRALLAGHAASVVVFSLFHTSWNWGSRELAFGVFRLGDYDYGIMLLRYLMEFPNDILLYAILVALVTLFDHYRRNRDREVRLARLEGEVATLRLRALEAQLQPHFLFNALNTISSVMYEDVRAADGMIARLSDLLRRTLRNADVPEVPLADEVETIGLYVDLMRARFPDRLAVELRVDDTVRAAAVPQLILQPLVENAFRHGDPGPGEVARITLTAGPRNGRLELVLEDNGPGLAVSPDEAMRRGVGLANTTRRLEQLYGDRQKLTLSNRHGGGLRVAVSIPYRVLAVSPDAQGGRTPLAGPGRGAGAAW